MNALSCSQGRSSRSSQSGIGRTTYSTTYIVWNLFVTVCARYVIVATSLYSFVVQPSFPDTIGTPHQPTNITFQKQLLAIENHSLNNACIRHQLCM